ncbi:MAG TPA: aspartate/glutamate racemase family protein [Rhizomicrobium sp.]|jgi:aspartate racemase|nr:aspartate/glutamate racemase family protein [Rhizomicrobium sp.]
MKTIGILGGMSWESSSVYYQLLNREVQKRLGGVHSAKLLLYSFDFDEMSVLQRAGRWDEANARMAAVASDLAGAGADFLVIACNTMHCATPDMARAVSLPLLHIADPLGAAIKRAGMRRIGLLGSQYTMEQDGVIRGRLRDAYDIEVLTPGGDDAAEVSRVIYEELVRGQFLDTSRAAYRGIIARLIARGAQGIVLGCTELPLLVKPEDSSVPLFDTTTLHAMAAVDYALAD